MARISFSSGRRSVFSRVLLLIAGLALIAFCVIGLALEFFGVTTTATVTSVNFREERRNNRDRYTTSAYVQYTFEVDGTDYTGSATFSVSSDNEYAKSGIKYLSNYDLKFREEWSDRKSLKIKYLPMNPQTSDAAEFTQKGFWGTAFRIAGIALGVLLLIFAFKPNKKPKTAAYQISQQSTPYAPSGYEYTPASQQSVTTPPRFCPHCGAQTGESRFCSNCGNRLV